MEEREEEVEAGFEVDEKEKDRFMCAREGDHVFGIGFECDVCHFRNINKRDVLWGSRRDLNTLVAIRRATLDAMWSREESVVKGNFNRMRRDLEGAAKNLSVGNIFPAMGNPELEDKKGMGLAVIMLEASKRPGKYANHLQYDTMRKAGTWYMNAHEAIRGDNDGSVFAADNRTMHVQSQSPGRSGSLGFFLGPNGGWGSTGNRTKR